MYVLIATAGLSDLLRSTLDGVAACAKPKGFKGVVLVENGGESTAGTLVSHYHGSLDIEYMFEPVGNKSMALNRGLRRIREGLVVLFDDDIRIDPGTLLAYAESNERFPRAVFWGGSCACDYEERPPNELLKFLPLCARGWSLESDEAIELPHALGFNWAVRAESVLELGGFAEDRGPGTPIPVGDEYHMQKKLIQNFAPGRFVAAAKVWHYVPRHKCDAKWLVKRGYDYGVAKAMEAREEGVLPAVPWFVWRRLVTSTLKWWVLRWSPNPVKRMKAGYGRAINRGLVVGYKMDVVPSGGGSSPGASVAEHRESS